MSNFINSTWECYLCDSSQSFKVNPSAYLSNYHPLCKNCSDKVLEDDYNPNRSRLTFHEKIGDIKLILNIPVENGFPKLN